VKPHAGIIIVEPRRELNVPADAIASFMESNSDAECNRSTKCSHSRKSSLDRHPLSTNFLSLPGGSADAETVSTLLGTPARRLPLEVLRQVPQANNPKMLGKSGQHYEERA